KVLRSGHRAAAMAPPPRRHARVASHRNSERHSPARATHTGTVGTTKDHMLATAHSSTLVGLEAYPVQVEVDIARGLPTFDLVGLPETSVKESRVRVRSALDQVGFPLPPKRVTINLAPADVRKY